MPKTPRYVLQSGDVIRNLRSALDHSMTEVFLRKLSGNDIRKHAFPIADSHELWLESASLRSIRQLAPAYAVILEELAPFGGTGRKEFVLLRDLADWDQHNLLIVANFVARFEPLELVLAGAPNKKIAFEAAVNQRVIVATIPGAPELLECRMDTMTLIPLLAPYQVGEQLRLLEVLETLCELVGDTVERMERAFA